MKRFIIAVGSLLSLPLTVAADYSPRDFLAAAPAETFYTEDEMSEDEKQKVLRAPFDTGTNVTCEAWAIVRESPSSLTLQICPDSFIRIQLYREASGDTLVAVESNRSSGRSFELQFFQVSGESNALSLISDERLKALGLDDVTENDLLAERDRFPPGAAERVFLSLDESGQPRATLRSWNNPRWARRTVSFDVRFDWNGSRFNRRVVPLPSEPSHLQSETGGTKS
jgi:hypothetical protein